MIQFVAGTHEQYLDCCWHDSIDENVCNTASERNTFGKKKWRKYNSNITDEQKKTNKNKTMDSATGWEKKQI